MSRIFLGTSGWSYKEWVGPLYDSEDEVGLSSYAKVFDTAEINSTFYAYPSKGIVYGWAKHSKKGFIFTAKIPRLITHEKKLALEKDVEGDLNRFCDLMDPLRLRGKLGCLLIQLPPRFERDYERLEGFLKILPDRFRFAVEFRHRSWMIDEAWRLLEKYNVAYTIVDEPLLPPEVHVTADLAYFRWHGRGHRPWFNYLYDVEELEPWIPRIREVSERVEVTLGYFNNHFHGYAVENCLQVLEMLGLLSHEQAQAKEKAEEHLEERMVKRAKEKKRGLVEFIGAGAEVFDGLLREFIDEKRLVRARRIRDDEIMVEKSEGNLISARIRDYRVVIDLEARTILHDCADWDRCIPRKRFCKHMGKVFLVLPRESATSILERIRSEKEGWEFRPIVEQ